MVMIGDGSEEEEREKKKVGQYVIIETREGFKLLK